LDVEFVGRHDHAADEEIVENSLRFYGESADRSPVMTRRPRCEILLPVDQRKRRGRSASAIPARVASRDGRPCGRCCLRGPGWRPTRRRCPPILQWRSQSAGRSAEPQERKHGTSRTLGSSSSTGTLEA
jgi:hypothetical protein